MQMPWEASINRKVEKIINSEEKAESLKLLAPVCLISQQVLEWQGFLQALFLVNSHTGILTADSVTQD